ncbi:hypothetical protein F5B22DRAFT_636055 [Xylaria bambusicola]|uniref:uncharacterized protein n=1 Tax=Xylaria bambusicola TaxID=326684 RepID=UPI002007EBD6|nr:uncharacterized protein F5B22DRAFT_636055 [Xylaria bambusicola]KAI0517121.1 hypothetical protein F5B22DRAFT_636055 [Xylaria bambusicola]
MSQKRPRGTDGYSDDGSLHGTSEHRSRTAASLAMSESEWRSRERRRLRFLSRNAKKPDDNTPEVAEDQTGVAVEAGEAESSQLAGAVGFQEGKPWQSLVVGNLGENLSHIERKNREIEQQEFIVRYHEQHSPNEVDHNRRILNQLIQERAGMEDNEENHMPEDQREKRNRISQRLELLRWILDNSKCEDEKINVRAAIQGYESGQIPYSHDFTLLYAGHVVDRCRDYKSFCVDRHERLDRYAAEHGPGWLWQEPPLAGTGNDVLAKKGICLMRNFQVDKYGIGTYQIALQFRVQRDKVSSNKRKRTPEKTSESGDATEIPKKARSRDASCRLGTLLDSGATFPIILQSDLARLNMNMTEYPAQGVMEVNVVGGRKRLKWYEISLVSRADEAVWPAERPTLGGFCPVLAQEDQAGSTSFSQRLSGMVPFDACYLSSGPGMSRIWLGEDRRDVLGTSRLPAHLRFDTDKKFVFQLPEELETLRAAAQTPDRVVFLHESLNESGDVIVDADTNIRGRSEIAIGKYQAVDRGPGQKPYTRVVPNRVIQLEPRKGGIKAIPKRNPRWRSEYVKPQSS